MTEVSCVVAVAPEAVFAVLADGWTYPAWVVGNTRVRHVDPAGLRRAPQRGSVAGAAPAPSRRCATSSTTGCSNSTRACGSWVRFTLTQATDGTQVAMAERVVRGRAGAVPVRWQALLWRPRNNETLARLADLATAWAPPPR